MPLTILPDVETLVVAALAAQSSITAIVTDRISTVIPSAPTFPLIRVTEVADYGPDPEGARDALVEIECWATDDATASLLARTVEACRLDLRRITGGGWVALTEVTSGPIPAPDPDSERFRYMLDLAVQVGA